MRLTIRFRIQLCLDNKPLLIPICWGCEVDLIYTQFDSGVGRYLCPRCKGKFYVEKSTGGLVEAKGYSIRRHQDDT